ncbi:hypothetical protein BD410DRAFT_831727 [Rickenella mellea]|uniref:F-box domain-containing protein n=1 Tax=Rickenella mellea TaxID=50990 RepID=A0A4Y7PPK1_9AGAM|nr:hypothetical protein BD410DRAFT_831727 [Rickenella mellea]
MPRCAHCDWLYFPYDGSQIVHLAPIILTYIDCNFRLRPYSPSPQHHHACKSDLPTLRQVVSQFNEKAKPLTTHSSLIPPERHLLPVGSLFLRLPGRDWYSKFRRIGMESASNVPSVAQCLPIDVLESIFLTCVPDFKPDYYDDVEFPSPSAYEAPMIYGQICRLWRDVSLTMPRLWSFWGSQARELPQWESRNG